MNNPHPDRRRQLLTKYPEIKKLMGYDPRSKYIAFAMLFTQLLIAVYLPPVAWWQLLLLCFVIGGTLNHGISMAIHECSHNLFFKKIANNKCFSMLLNLALLLPIAISFRHYHLAHHRFLGEVGHDTDLPTDFEAHYCRQGFAKYIWFLFFHLIYIIRPILVKKDKITVWNILNLLLQIVFIMTLAWVNPLGLCYLLLSVLVGLSLLHPLSGHFLSEHFIFSREPDVTFSYYGWLNIFVFNVGYHYEHHDFPNISGFKLKALHQLASPDYQNKFCHRSWIQTLWFFFKNTEMGAHKRIQSDSPRSS